MTRRGNLIETFSIYSEECLVRLKNALAKAEEAGDTNDAVPMSEMAAINLISSRYADSSSSSSDEEVSERGGNESETASSEESLNEDDEGDKGASREKEADDAAEAEKAHVSPDAGREAAATAPGSVKRPKLKTKQREVLKHVEMLSCIALPLTEPEHTALEIPSSLLSKEERLSNNLLKQCRSCLSLAAALQEKTVVVLFLRSGRFAGAVFQGDGCICHRTLQKYTVRKGQGKAQSAQDSQRRPKSMGSQLRRAGEQRLREDVTKTILEWKDYIQQAALILISCPKTMKKSLFDDGLQEQILSKNDPRIRRVPLDLGRPTFENVCLIHSVMMTATVREITLPASVAEDTDTTSTNIVAEEEAKLGGGAEPCNTVEKTKDEPIEIPLTALHVAAQEADLDKVLSLLESDESKEQINQLAGEFLMTPLHLAASSAVDGGNVQAAAADCVYQLLVTGRADPCLVDVRNRPPYFLASSDKVRDAFRKARAVLGEDYCDWDDGKVGPPLTEEDIRLKKDKEAEKKRKKRARQKEKKAKEKAHAEATEKQRREEEERRKQEEDAKRIRNGLQPKVSSAGNVCDYCQKVCNRKRRGQMLQRLEYAYCSTDCVQKHKRELMAAAALSRFEG